MAVMSRSSAKDRDSVTFTGQHESRVGGTRVEVTDAELAAAGPALAKRPS